MSETANHLAGIPVITNEALPVGAFYCHPDTLRPGKAAFDRIIAAIDIDHEATIGDIGPAAVVCGTCGAPYEIVSLPGYNCAGEVKMSPSPDWTPTCNCWPAIRR